MLKYCLKVLAILGILKIGEFQQVSINVVVGLCFLRLVLSDFGICFLVVSFVGEKSFRHELIVQIFCGLSLLTYDPCSYKVNI